MIQKLLLVRVQAMRSTLLETAGLKPFAGEPICVSPRAWADEAGLSHYGFVLNGLKLKDWQELQKWDETTPDVTVLEHEEGADVEATLATAGLRINKSAEE